MKIKPQLFIFFSLVIVLSVGVSAYLAISYTQSSILDAEIAKMETHNTEVMHNLETLHARASEDLVFALQNPKFVEYFELPETKSGNVYDTNGVLQFTENQRKLKQDLEQWIYHFQNKFSVDETCLIDFSGQEHARLVLSRIEIDSNLSPDEKSASFFEPSFVKKKNEVHVQYPYVSPDTKRWVFAYTSPIELASGQKPAIYHFEMPMSVFENLLDGSNGRMYVVDPNGFIVADTENNLSQTVISADPQKQFPGFQTVFAASSSSEILDEMKSKMMGTGKYAVNGEDHYYVYEKLSTFDWILVYEKPVSMMLSGNNSLGNLFTSIALIAIGVSAVGILSVFLISSRISRPISLLSEQISLENPERLEAIETSDNELGTIAHSVNDLIKKMNDYQEQIHLQNQELTIQKQQLEKMAKIGESASKLSHNLRGPLTVIKASVEMILRSSNSIDDTTRTRLERIKSSSENLESQIKDVLSYIREKPLQITDIKLNELIKIALEHMDVPNTITIITPKTDYALQCDTSKLEIVLTNIISNAIDALDNHGTIQINSTLSNHDIQISISDDGPGISNDNLNKIFDSLFTTKATGTGLGLPYCKSIVEQHGGSITVSQNPTTFTITLPRKTISKKL
jgi:signal transduction histidine kinase